MFLFRLVHIITWKLCLCSIVFNIDRRGWIWNTLTASTTSFISYEQNNVIISTDDKRNDDISISIPLEKCSGGRNCVRITIEYQPVNSIFDQTLSYVPFKVFKLAIDTGSPYLVISDGLEFASFVNIAIRSNNKIGTLASFLIERLGFLENDVQFNLYESGFSPTFDIYGSQSGTILWKKGYVQFSKFDEPISLILGVLDDNLSEESGGSLLGLVKKSSKIPTQKVQTRPTFLDQLRLGNKTVSSFTIDSPNQRLTMSTNSMISSNDMNVMSLVNLLELGDFVDHYGIKIDQLQFGDMSLSSKTIANTVGSEVTRDIVAIFDTGLTGCLLTTPLWNDLTFCGLNLKDIHSLDVAARTDSSKLFHFTSSETENPFFNIRPITLDWFDDEMTSPYVVVLGQSFLNKGSLTIDLENRKVLFCESH